MSEAWVAEADLCSLQGRGERLRGRTVRLVPLNITPCGRMVS